MERLYSRRRYMGESGKPKECKRLAEGV